MEPELEIFIMNDQPVTCPNCGCRTDFMENFYSENTGITQLHQCPDSECQFKFYVVES